MLLTSVAVSALLTSCNLPVASAAPLVTLADAKAAVIHHWDINRQALRATSAAEAKRLIEQVEGGDALKIDEATIARDAAARGSVGNTAPAIPAATGVRVFVPRQSGYPAVFMSVRAEAQTDAAGAPTGKSVDVLEVFKRVSASAPWLNTGYAEVAAGLTSKLDITLDRDGYAALADGGPDPASLSTLYSGYISALLASHPDQASKRIVAGKLSDQFVSDLKKALAQAQGVVQTATFSASTHQEGIALKTGSGTFVLFDNLYDVTTTPASGGCVSGGQGSAVPGNFSSVTEHFLQNVGAIVAPGADSSVQLIAESDGPTAVDTKPCTSGGAVV